MVLASNRFSSCQIGYERDTKRRSALTKLAGTLLLSAFAIQHAHAQDDQSAGQAGATTEQTEQVVVTGSRIVRDGYQAPTPTTVLGTDQLEAEAQPNIADTIDMLPEFSGGVTPHASGGGGSTPSKGENELNLRGLGADRTLVLMDGIRVPEASLDGAVDINELPSALVSRVDVVTGGASAAYGSDALAGVVNFVLDKEFTGIKASAEGGVTTYGDDGNYDLTFTAGVPFDNGRGHVLFNAESAWNAGIFDIPRKWAQTGWQTLNNPNYTPTNGQPQLLVEPQVGLAEATYGGLINSGPLKGTAFGQGGVPYQFDYGSVAIGGVLMQGGEWQANNNSLDSGLDQEVDRNNIFSRIAYNITDNLEVWGIASYSTSTTTAPCCDTFYLPSVTIQAGNPFIPPSVAAAMTANKLTSIPVGRILSDLPRTEDSDTRDMYRFAVGVDGNINAFGVNWNWDAFGQQGISRNIDMLHTAITGNFDNAINAVNGPNGSIVCASTLTNPGNGCVPYDVFGTNVNSQAAANYIQGTAWLNQDVVQNVAGVNFRGEPFSDWAGPISLATGAEYRREFTSGQADPLSAQDAYFAGNFIPTFGHYSVWETYAETVVPLVEDAFLAKSLDLNAAIRGTDYSTSGYVTTWKVGATYTPFDDIKFRATRSRDIRAPNLSDLFTAGTRNTGPIQDPTMGNISYNAQTVTEGNQNLKPEVADTTGFGVVLQPHWIPGFNASVDYYDIHINGAISSDAAQDAVYRCAAGDTIFCAGVIRSPTSGQITQVIVQEYNYVTQVTSGLDIEASYQFPLEDFVDGWKGNFALRALGTRVFNDVTNNDEVIQELAGTNSGSNPPRWRWLLSAIYDNDPITITLTGRAISSGTYNNAYVVCTTGCPTSTANNMTINTNHIDGAFYTDFGINYRITNPTVLFVTVQNILNRAPAVVAPSGGSSFYEIPANPILYDTIGREFHFGVRIAM